MWLIVGYILGGTLLAFYLLIKYITGRQDYWLNRGVETRKLKPIGSLPERLKRPFHELDIETYKEMKSRNLQYMGKVEARTPILFIRDPDTIKQILVKDFDHFPNRRGIKVGDSDPYFHKLLFNMQDQPWKELRVTMTPTFTSGKIKLMFSIFNQAGIDLVRYIQNDLRMGATEIDMKDTCGKYTLHVISSAAFGIGSECFTSETPLFLEMSKRIINGLAVNKISDLKFVLLLLSPKLFHLFGFSVFDKAAIEFFQSVLRTTIAKRGSGSEGGGSRRNDFLQLMLDAKNGKLRGENGNDAVGNDQRRADLTDDVILAQCLLFLLAGYDTTEVLLSFTAYELAMNPEVQEKLFQEIRATFNACGGNQLTYEAVVNEMAYLDMVVSETLRKYPPAFRLDRKCNSEYSIPNTNIIIEKDTIVVIPVLPMQNDPEIYPEPEKFIPERFSSENKASRNPYHYLPFGVGPRSCIAMRFALIEGKTAIAHLINNFKLEPSGATPIPLKFAKSVSGLKLSGGLCLSVTSRN